jgi:hypothetical protein
MSKLDAFQPNKVVSAKQKITPLKEGETATFALLSYGKSDGSRIDLDTKKPIPTVPATYVIAGRERVLNVDTGAYVYIQNENGVQTKVNEKGEPYDVPTVEPIRIFNGILNLTHRDNAKFIFMSMSNKNANNPYRDKNKGAVFYRLDQKRKQDNTAKQYLFDNKMEAFNIIKKADIEELKAICMTLPKNFNLSIHDTIPVIKTNLMTIADRQPDLVILANTKNHAAKLQVELQKALNFGVVEFEDSVWSVVGVNGKNDVICKVEAGEDMFEGIVKHINSGKQQAKWDMQYKAILAGLSEYKLLD